ncbi:hypothetical protein MTR67_030165 [Solanum verrucosum]|uniref:Uncharacterized protein n=1 Tax=Solanum verrucosum TaxID=315347 RepID=A0AAF0RC98_SOLVR|nr:hypothetical protein MTR67_030165 [Solanum verrucosum]
MSHSGKDNVGAKHVIVLFCDAPMKNIKGAIIRAVVVFIHNFPNVRPFSPVSDDVEKICRVGISFKPFDPSFLFEDRLLKFEKSSEFGLEPREISLVISGVFGYIVVFKSLNLSFKSLRFFVEVPKSLSRPRTHSFNEDSPTDSAELKIGNRSKRDLDAENLNLHHETIGEPRTTSTGRGLTYGPWMVTNEDSPTDSAELKIGNRSKRDLDAENLNLHHEKM